jgi:hypothetical protein
MRLRSFQKLVILGALGASVSGAVACGLRTGEDEEAGSTSEALVQNQSGTPITGEELLANAGTYRAVARSGFMCTATIIAPYLAVTSASCAPPNELTYADGSSLNGARWRSPYLNEPHFPAWWRALNDAQKAAGGNQDDSPAMHDIAILFLPDVTPAWMANKGIRSVPIVADVVGTQYGGPGAASVFSTKSFISVGTSGGRRNYGPAKFLAPVANSITAFPRDGYVTRDGRTPGFVQPRRGDEGGPTFWEGPNGTELGSGRILAGVTLNACKGRGLDGGNDPSNMNVEACTSGGDIAPIGAFEGMTENQRWTAIRNAQWIQSQIVDTDGDGITNGCDVYPLDRTKTESLCAAPFQPPGPGSYPSAALLPNMFAEVGPSANSDVTPAKVKLCGIRSNSGWLVDNLQLLYCRETSDGAVVYSSTTFGGNGGGSQTDLCPSGSWISHFNVWTNYDANVNYRLTALQPVCTNGTTTTTLPIRGREGGALTLGPHEYMEKMSCDGSTGKLTGLLAYQAGPRTLSALYPICEKPAGGSHGGH